MLVAPNRADPNPVACVEANERFRVGLAPENAPLYDRPADPLRPLAEPNSDEPLRVEVMRELENAPVSPRPDAPNDLLSKLESACDVDTDDVLFELGEFTRAEFVEPPRIEFALFAESVPREAPDDDDRAAAELPPPLRAPPNELKPSDLPALEAAPPVEEEPRAAISLEFDPRFALAVAPPWLLSDAPPNECQLPSATAGRALEGIRLEVLWKVSPDPRAPIPARAPEDDGPAARPPAEDRGA